MAQILQALRGLIAADPNVTLVHTSDVNGFADMKITPYARRVKLFVGVSIPGISGLWHSEYLNSMMAKFVPAGVVPTFSEPFRDETKSLIAMLLGIGKYDILRLGYNEFKESVGMMKRLTTYTITDPDLVNTPGFPGGVKQEEVSNISLDGQVTFALYPNVAAAEEAARLAENEDDAWAYGIPVSDFERLGRTT